MAALMLTLMLVLTVRRDVHARPGLRRIYNYDTKEDYPYNKCLSPNNVRVAVKSCVLRLPNLIYRGFPWFTVTPKTNRSDGYTANALVKGTVGTQPVTTSVSDPMDNLNRLSAF